jgi:hypothetical protein
VKKFLTKAEEKVENKIIVYWQEWKCWVESWISVKSSHSIRITELVMMGLRTDPASDYFQWFLVVLVFELRTLHLLSRCCNTESYPQPFFCCMILLPTASAQLGSQVCTTTSSIFVSHTCMNFLPGLSSMILLISASQVAGIMDMSHHARLPCLHC